MPQYYVLGTHMYYYVPDTLPVLETGAANGHYVTQMEFLLLLLYIAPFRRSTDGLMHKTRAIGTNRDAIRRSVPEKAVGSVTRVVLLRK